MKVAFKAPRTPREFLPHRQTAASFTSGWRVPDAAGPLDGAREHHVRKVHPGERRVVLWCRPLGNILLRKAALLRKLQRARKYPLAVVCNHSLAKRKGKVGRPRPLARKRRPGNDMERSRQLSVAGC